MWITRSGGMVRKLVVGLAAMMLGVVSGCALLSPLPWPPTPPSADVLREPTPQAQMTSALAAANQLLAELRAASQGAVNVSTAPAPAATAPATASGRTDSLDRETQVLALLTTALQQLNTSLQNAPSAQAQQQAAFNSGVQTAQTAAVAFGGPYGALIAAGIGILSVLVQGMANTSKAHQAAQAANQTAQALAGKLPPIPH